MEVKKPKILFISDDIRLQTGVGIQARKIMYGLQATGKYDIVEIAGSLIKQPPKPVSVNDIKLYPVSDGYGNEAVLRYVLKAEKPDIIVAFSDPRFFKYLFSIDNEIRDTTRIILYHTWDNDPFPKYNEKWYAACDKVILISEFSHKLMTDSGVDCIHIPHIYDNSEFYVLPDDKIQEERDYLLDAVSTPNIDFIVFWNNRNIERKRPGDVIAAFSLFCKTYPNSLLIMNTDASDPNGTDLIHLQNDLNTGAAKLIYNFTKLPVDKLNAIYNAADISLNISFNEGFGLATGESLLAGTPVVATRTGGIPEQMTNGNTTYGVLIEPMVKSLFGVPGTPYIYRDYVSIDSVYRALEEAYKLHQRGFLKTLGRDGGVYIANKYQESPIIQKWEAVLDEQLARTDKFKKWSTISI